MNEREVSLISEWSLFVSNENYNLIEKCLKLAQILEYPELSVSKEIDDIKGQVPALFSLGLLQEEKGNAQKAQEYFSRVLAINPNHIQARDMIKNVH